MPVFEPGKPVETDSPLVIVEPSDSEPLLPGTYTFQLVVIDDEGNESAPDQAKIVIVDPGPRAVIQADERVPFGQRFELNGEASSDIGDGKIVSYIWTLVERG